MARMVLMGATLPGARTGIPDLRTRGADSRTALQRAQASESNTGMPEPHEKQ